MPFPLLRAATVSVLVLASPATGRGEDRRTDPDTLVVMQLNAEFLWDGLDPEEGNAQFPWRDDEAAARAHMRQVADIIRRGNPDILNLCEVENIEALETLNTDFLADLGYRAYLLDGQDSATGQDVGPLSRIDPTAMRRDDRQGRSGNVRKGVSKNYVAEFAVNGRHISLIAAHLLAFPTNQSRKLSRQAQAAALGEIAAEEQLAGNHPRSDKTESSAAPS